MTLQAFKRFPIRLTARAKHSLFQSKDEPEGSEGVAKPGFVLSGFEFNSA